MISLPLVVAIIAIGVIFVMTLVARDKNIKLAAILIPILCFGVYAGWDSSQDLLGYPTTRFSQETKFLFLGSESSPPDWIYLLVHPIDRSEPIYIKIPWTKASAQMIEQANEMLRQGKTVAGFLKPKKPGMSIGDGSGTEDDSETGDVMLYEFSVKDATPKHG